MQLIRSFLVLSTFFFVISSPIQASLQSSIFSYDDDEKPTQLNVNLSGESKGLKWTAENVSEKDIPFFAQCYSNPKIMSMFGAGLVRDPKESTEYATMRIKAWRSRFQKLQPHGGLIVKDDSGHSIGHLVAGGGDAAGVSEAARFILPEIQGKGLGTSLLKTVVEVWAPEVSRLGRDEKSVDIQQAFQCFGGKALERIDVTSSPSNVASWRSQDKAGFIAAEFLNTSPEGEYQAAYEGKEFEGVRTRDQYSAMEKDLLLLFDINAGDKALKAGIRYRMLDLKGVERTFSKHTKYERIKYHAEYNLPQ